jgi:hypothetical protein
MSAGQAVAVAVTFVWLGMIVAIGFVEAPLKFRAPNVTLQIGLGIGRLVFRALNRIELVFVVVISLAGATSPPSVPAVIAYAVAFAVLATQLAVVRPRLNRRADQVLAGAEGPRSRVHYFYVGLEVTKVIALVTAGAVLLSS